MHKCLVEICKECENLQGFLENQTTQKKFLVNKLLRKQTRIKSESVKGSRQYLLIMSAFVLQFSSGELFSLAEIRTEQNTTVESLKSMNLQQ